jgi:hypothetical protein
MTYNSLFPTTMSLSSFPEELLAITAEYCAALQREDDLFYERFPLMLNHGVEALSQTASSMRRVCLPILFRTIFMRGGFVHSSKIDYDLRKLLELVRSEDRRIAQHVRYV